MALPTLATTADLDSRDITGADEETMLDFLEAASTEVRNAAGVPISRATFTVDLPGTRGVWLDLPGTPVVSVEDVKVDGEDIDDWKLVGGRLWRAVGWQGRFTPSVVTVTITGGYVDVPPDIVDLVCAMVGAAVGRMSEDGYASRGDLVGTRIDDYSEQYASGVNDRLAGPIELPERTRRRLAARFGGSAHVIGVGR